MNLIVDSNIIFTFFWKSSLAHDLFPKFNLFLPEFALMELKKYEKEIIEKSGISKEEFTYLRNELCNLITFVPLEEYSSFLQESKNISSDTNDVNFFALALKLNCPIWSNDAVLKKQDIIIIFNSKEIIELLL